MTCFFFILSDIYEEKMILWHQKNVTQWSGSSIIIFVWVILYSTGTYFSCYYFLLERKSKCPCFPRFFIQFSKYWVLEMNQLKSWVYLQIGNLEFWVVFCSLWIGFFEQSSHLHILVFFCISLYFSLSIATAILTSLFTFVILVCLHF